MEIVNFFIIQTFFFIDKVMFSPLVLIGLLITSLSLILNLKETNNYIEKFKKGNNSKKFINIIYSTIVVLLLIFLLNLIKLYITLPENFTIISTCFYGLFSLIYMSLILYILTSLFSISFMLKEIVLTSLKE